MKIVDTSVHNNRKVYKSTTFLQSKEHFEFKRSYPIFITFVFLLTVPLILLFLLASMNIFIDSQTIADDNSFVF